MDSRRPPTESFTITVSRSTRNVLLAKLIIVIGLTALFSTYFISNCAKQYEAGKQLTQETYLAHFEDRKAALLSQGQYATNTPLVVLGCFMTVGFLIDSYELVILVLGFMVGKLVRR